MRARERLCLRSSSPSQGAACSQNVTLNLTQYFSPACRFSMFMMLLQIGFHHLQTKEPCICVCHHPYHFILNFPPLN